MAHCIKMNCPSQYISKFHHLKDHQKKNPSITFDAKHFLKYYPDPSIFLHKNKFIRGLNQRPTQRTHLLSRSSLSFLRQKWQTVHSCRSTPFLTCFCMTYTPKPWHTSISQNSTCLHLLKLLTSQIPYSRCKAGIWGEKAGKLSHYNTFWSSPAVAIPETPTPAMAQRSQPISANLAMFISASTMGCLHFRSVPASANVDQKCYRNHSNNLTVQLTNLPGAQKPSHSIWKHCQHNFHSQHTELT